MHFVRINCILSSQIYLSFNILAPYKAVKSYYAIKDIGIWDNFIMLARNTPFSARDMVYYAA